MTYMLIPFEKDWNCEANNHGMLRTEYLIYSVQAHLKIEKKNWVFGFRGITNTI